MAKHTKITIESDSLLILRSGSSQRAWCPRCAAEGDMIALENAGVVSNLDHRWLNTHLPEFTSGSRAKN